MADDQPKAQPVKLFITSCVAVYHGKNNRGDDYTIHEVQAKRENGEEVAGKKLTSFEDLPLGELLDLTVTKFTNSKGQVSFTLARQGAKAGTKQRIEQLQGQVTDLVERMQKVESWIRRHVHPSTTTDQPTQDQPPTQDQQPTQDPSQQTQRQSDLDERFGADAPF